MKWKGIGTKKSPTPTRKKTSRNHSLKSVTHKKAKLQVLGSTEKQKLLN